MKVFLSGSQIARSLNFPAESVVSVSLVLNALSCSVVTSHSALRKEGKLPGGTDPMPTDKVLP